MSSKKKIAVILAGCGVYDGSEIHEATLTMLAIDRHGAYYQCFAPDMDQYHVVNHMNGSPMKEKRNILVESARIARGKIKSLDEFHTADFDAVIFPGGFGVAKNLCTYAFDKENCSVNAGVTRVIREMHAAAKPIGALCISPIMIVKLLGEVEVTIGHDPATARSIRAMGGVHIPKDYTQTVTDLKNKVVTTPCYMLDASISQVADGADNVVKEILKMC